MDPLWGKKDNSLILIIAEFMLGSYIFEKHILIENGSFFYPKYIYLMTYLIKFSIGLNIIDHEYL